MSAALPRRAPSDQDSFEPQLVSALKAGYSIPALKADAIAGLTVAIVALPLSMAIAIASGAQPSQGLITAVVGGFLISALGGSRYQVGGPAGAFIVLVAATIEHAGYGGFLTATILAGVMLLGIGYLSLGGLIKFIPHAVIVGFSAGIAVIIGASQLKDFFGLTLAHEPAAFLPKLEALWGARATFSFTAFALSLVCMAIIIALRVARPRWPGFIVAVIFGSVVVWLLKLPVETIGTRFGGIPSSFPLPTLPDLNPETILAVFPAAITIALLGGIESLLSAVVADSMTGTRHRPNAEIVAQGFANIATALFGGICATGTIARTATNIRARAATPVSGILHSLFVLGFILLAAPLASYIPLSALAAILTMVVWNMADKHEFMQILKHDRADTAVLLTTFLLTIFIDLPTGIGAGVSLGAIIFMYRVAQTSAADIANTGAETPTVALKGVLFTGTMGKVADELALVEPKGPKIIVDLDQVFMADASSVPVLMAFILRMRRLGTEVTFFHTKPAVMRVLQRDGVPAELFV